MYKNFRLLIVLFLSVVGVSTFCMDSKVDIQAKLIESVQDGNVPAVQFLIDKGANVHAGCAVGNLLMHHAGLAGHTHMVKFLKSRGLGLHGYDAKGFALLHQAAVSGSIELLDYLINGQKLDINVTSWDECNYTPLHLAVLNNKVSIVKLLIIMGADINAKCGLGLTPLHLAASLGFVNQVNYLLQNGADQEAKNDFGYTVLDLAAMHDHANVIQLLVEKFCFDPIAQSGKAYQLAKEISADNALAELEYQMHYGIS